MNFVRQGLFCSLIYLNQCNIRNDAAKIKLLNGKLFYVLLKFSFSVIAESCAVAITLMEKLFQKLTPDHILHFLAFPRQQWGEHQTILNVEKEYKSDFEHKEEFGRVTNLLTRNTRVILNTRKSLAEWLISVQLILAVQIFIELDYK